MSHNNNGITGVQVALGLFGVQLATQRGVEAALRAQQPQAPQPPHGTLAGDWISGFFAGLLAFLIPSGILGGIFGAVTKDSGGGAGVFAFAITCAALWYASKTQQEHYERRVRWNEVYRDYPQYQVKVGPAPKDRSTKARDSESTVFSRMGRKTFASVLLLAVLSVAGVVVLANVARHVGGGGSDACITDTTDATYYSDDPNCAP